MSIFAKILSLMIFGQIWSHNLDFFKLTKISQMGTLLYAYYSFNVLFFQNSFHSYFLGKFGPKIWSFSNWLKFWQISFQIVFFILTELHRISMLNFSKYGEQQNLGWNFPPKIYKWQILRKITHQNYNQYKTICPCIKFQSIWRTLGFA